jgi:hypothetical protein
MITENVKENTLDSSDDEGVDKGAQSKKEKEEIFKKMLSYETTRTHELLAKTFYMAKLKESKTILESSLDFE